MSPHPFDAEQRLRSVSDVTWTDTTTRVKLPDPGWCEDITREAITVKLPGWNGTVACGRRPKSYESDPDAADIIEQQPAISQHDDEFDCGLAHLTSPVLEASSAMTDLRIEVSDSEALKISTVTNTKNGFQTPGNPSRPCATQTLHLLDLPQEILDRILETAYVKRKDVRVISRATWALEEAGYGDDYDEYGFCQTAPSVILSRFPGCAVDKFLVSKSYFTTAVPAYFRHSRFDLELWCPSEVSVAQCEGQGSGIIGAFVKDISLPLRDWKRLPQLPRLRQLRLDFCEDFFDGVQLGCDDAWDGKVSTEAMAKAAAMCVPERVDCDVRLTVVACKRCIEAEDPTLFMQTNHLFHKANIEALDSLVRELVRARSGTMTPDTGSYDSGESVMLYPGSKVQLNAPKN